MQLRYITLFIDYGSGFMDPFRDQFNLHSRFVSNYLSIQVRKLKIKTDGTFNLIGISPSLNIKHICRIVGEKSLQVRIEFDRRYYERLSKQNKYEYYLQLLEEGYRISTQFKEIPVDTLLLLHQKFREGGYKNEWVHKAKRFKEYNIHVVLSCFFTSVDFQLVISIHDLKTKELLVAGTVIRTLPDEIHFQKNFKDVKIEKEELIITDFLDRPRVALKLTDIYKKEFRFSLLGKGLEYITYVPSNL